MRRQQRINVYQRTGDICQKHHVFKFMVFLTTIVLIIKMNREGLSNVIVTIRKKSLKIEKKIVYFYPRAFFDLLHFFLCILEKRCVDTVN